ncbi:MAG TPA: S41 family peptidase [Longimicrobiales bacterium]
MKIKRSIVAPLVLALIALASGGWLLQRGVSRDRNVYLQARLFEEVLHHVSDRFVEEKDPASLYRMAIDGLLQELGDPHSVFMTPEEYERLRVQTQGEYGGLGIQIDVRGGWVTVVAPLPGTPAERAGIQAGDRIIEVDGVSTKGWTSDQAVGHLRGPKGSTVNLKIARVGIDEPLSFRIVRDEIHVASVPTAYMLDDRVGYVELTVFSESSTQELRQAIDRLRAQGMRGLILDLRNNPGGLLDQGISVADLFLDRGKLISETRSRVASQNQKYRAVDEDHYPGMPIVVLVGRWSASASEILAGALQDHDRALIVGETTYGKGSVQTLFPLSGGNHLKLTTARWYTPLGRSIQKPYGIDRDRAVEEEVEEEEGAVEERKTTPKETFRTPMGRVVYGGGGIWPDVHVPYDTLATAEQEFVKSVQKYGSKFNDVVFDFAVRYAKAHPELKPGFPVGKDLLDGFYRALGENGIRVDRSLYDGAQRWIGRLVALEITNAKWGQQEKRKRWNADDPQVQVAARLLREAPELKTLFALAARYDEASAGDAGKSAGVGATPQR